MQNNMKYLIAVMLVLLLASFFVLRDSSQDSGQTTAMLIPELQDLINQVDGIKLQNNNNTITLTRNNNVWRVAEADGFIADTNKVAALLIDLRKLNLKQKKTRNPDNYGKLSLAESGENAATTVALQSESNTIADVAIGKRAPMSQGIYVKKSDAAQSWLSEGEITIKTSASDWILTDVLDIEPQLIRSVAFAPKGGPAFVINKLTPEDQSFVLADVPEGMKITSQAAIDAVAGGLQKLNIESARKKTADIQDDVISTITYQLFSGAIFKLNLIQQAEEKYLSITVTNDSSSEAVFTQELQNWLFVVPSFKFDALNKRLSDLTEKQEAQSAPEQPGQ